MKNDVFGVSDSDLEGLTGLFRLLSDRTRLNILFMLAEGEQNVTKLCELLKLPQPTVSHHLGLMRLGSVIANRRAGKQVYYGLDGRVGGGGEGSLVIGVDNFRVRIYREQDEIPAEITPQISAQSAE